MALSTYSQAERRRTRIADFKWKVLPLLTEEYQHISVFFKLIDAGGLCKSNVSKWLYAALHQLEREGRAEHMRDENFPGTYWRKK